MVLVCINLFIFVLVLYYLGLWGLFVAIPGIFVKIGYDVRTCEIFATKPLLRCILVCEANAYPLILNYSLYVVT